MKYFIDTNIIIDFLNQEESAIEKLTQLASVEDSELYINKLVCIESLRTIPYKNSGVFRESKQVLETFEKLEILPEIYEKAINFSRFCKTKGVQLKGKCEAIDFLHFITSKHYKLSLVSRDGDFDRLEEHYPSFLENLK
jgi:predicted nucleic acid-binding protein